jgi:ubiquinone biosynthesis protein COQ9
MDDDQFDSALIQAVMAQAEALGWRRVSVVGAAREAALPLDEARARFPTKLSVLLRLGLLADRAALVEDESSGSVRERLFDSLMRRIDVMQQYRGGVRAVLRALPFDPALGATLGLATLDSMRWLSEAAGIDTAGFSGRLRVKGVLGVWLQAMRAWDRDDSPDLSGTMAALDKALDRAERLGELLQRPLFGSRMPADDLSDLAPMDDLPTDLPGPDEAGPAI